MWLPKSKIKYPLIYFSYFNSVPISTVTRSCNSITMAEEDVAVTVSGSLDIDDSVLIARVKEALSRGSKKVNIINGFSVDTDSNVNVLTGPILGEITAKSAVVLLEVYGKQQRLPIVAKLYKEGDETEAVAIIEKEAKSKRPFAIKFDDLEPETRYTITFNGIRKYSACNGMATFKTKSEFPKTFHFYALSCDRNRRLLLGQQNPWLKMLKHTSTVDVVLHVGDQIYPDSEDIQNADEIFNNIFDELDDEKKHSMMLRARAMYRNKYRTVFSSKGKAELMKKVSNLMIWSDNDVANDFTTMKNENGSQMYHPHFLQCGMRAYREFQRRLWDPECCHHLGEQIEEWHSHVYGNVGIFMFDLRGNRIDGNGVQMSENPMIAENQWTDLEALFNNPSIRVIILCSETPFVGDEPETCKKTVADVPSLAFLRDHWPFNDSELIKLLDLCFTWKYEGERSGTEKEVLMIGGDIHCGVTSIIRDNDTGLQITQLTTSPVTNHVCQFFCKPSGNVSERYNYSHLPLGDKFRNYADVMINIAEDGVFVQAKLVPISTDIFKDTTWNVADSEDEDGGCVCFDEKH